MLNMQKQHLLQANLRRILTLELITCHLMAFYCLEQEKKGMSTLQMVDYRK